MYITSCPDLGESFKEVQSVVRTSLSNIQSGCSYNKHAFDEFDSKLNKTNVQSKIMFNI